jgi:hypothetical protein
MPEKERERSMMLYLSIPFILVSGIISGVVLRGFFQEAFSIFFRTECLWHGF